MWRETGLWQDVRELPETLERQGAAADVAALLRGARRVVATGNGAAYYVATALWLASLEGAGGPDVVAVPSGLVARGAFRWRPGDVMLAVSSSGEFRDVVEAVESAPRPYAAITATPDSTIGRQAGAVALVTVRSQRAVTHTQAFCGAVAQALAIWAEVASDRRLEAELRRLPTLAAGAIAAAESWAVDDPDPAAAIAFGSGPGWAAALEAALLLKELGGVPAEGVETREAATSAMMALQPEHLVLSLPAEDDPLLAEAEHVCRGRGAIVVRAPAPAADRRLAAVTTFPAAAALSVRIGLARGLDVDQPAWTNAYYGVAR